MKGLEHPVGATTIIVLTLLAPRVSRLHHERYHFNGPSTALILPVLLNFAAVWGVLAVLLAGAFRFRSLRISLWSILGVFSPGCSYRIASPSPTGHMSRPANAGFLAFLFVVATILLATRSAPSRFSVKADGSRP